MKLARLHSLLLSLALLPGLSMAQTRELSSNGLLLDRIAAVVNDGVGRLAGRKEDLEIGAARQRPVGQSAAVDAGHHDIGED